MDRVPLREKNTGNISASSSREKSMLTETPNTHQSRKITTPPESVVVSRKKSSILETPISKHFNDEGPNATNGESDNTKSALLSPAFSSPQQQNHRKMRDSFDIPPKPAFLQSSSASLESDDEKYRPKKKKKSRKESKDTPFHLGSHDKPPYSYATLIGMSILSNSERKLTLSQIYQWISDTFKYYRREEVGWQNSIRHNLSLNKAFIKGEKSKDGKGHFWCIQPGCEEQFLRSKNSKKHSYQEIIDQIYASIQPSKSSMNSIPSSPNISNEELKRKASDTDDAASCNTYGDEEYQEDDEEYTRSILDPPTKKQRLLSATTGNGTLETIPNLEAPFSQWQATPNGFTISNSPNNSNNPPQFVISESPDKPLLAGKNLTFTSSFSCNSNLELSPIRPSETGPLLEPLTPANNAYKNGHLLNHQLSTFHYQSHHPHMASSTTSSLLQQSIQQPHNVKTPKSCSRTPLRNLRTPQTASIMKKLWNSPSYLEEFYYSPLISSSHAALNSYDDDDMIMRAFELPSNNAQSQKKRPSMGSNSTVSSRNLFNDLKKVDHLSRNSSTSSSNEKDRTRLRNVSTSSTEQEG